MKMGIFRASSWAHFQGTFRVRALGAKPRFWSTAKELQGTIRKSLVLAERYCHHRSNRIISADGICASDLYWYGTVILPIVSYQVMEFVHLTCIISADGICASDLYRYTYWYWIVLPVVSYQVIEFVHLICTVSWYRF